MAERKTHLHFVTTADLAGANQAAAAVAKVGDAAKGSQDKLDAFEAEWKAKLASVQSKVDAARDTLHRSGEQNGKSLAEGMGKGLEIAANMHLIGQVWAVGSRIGELLGQVMTEAWEGALTQKIDGILAPFSDAAARSMAETLQAKVHDEMVRVNQAILRDQREFWKDYANLAPANAGDWLDAIEFKARRASQAMQFVVRMQAAEGDDRVARIEGEAEDARLRVQADPKLGENERQRRLLIIEQNRELALLAERNRQREDEVQRAQAEAQLKQQELQKLKAAESQQAERAKAAQQAEAIAKQRYEATGGTGALEAERRAAYQKISERTGLKLDPEQDEQAALRQARDKRFAAERAAIEQNTAAEAARREAAQRMATDNETVLRRTNRVEQQIRDTPPDAVKMPEDDPANRSKRIIPMSQVQSAPESTKEMRDLLQKAGKATGSPIVTNDAVALRTSLQDGAGERELKAAIELMQRMQGDQSAAVRQMAVVMREYIVKQQEELKAARAEMANLSNIVTSLRP